MLVYFDESYDSNKTVLILGALFVPKPSLTNGDVSDVKRALGYLDTAGNPREIKYTLSNNRERYTVARDCISRFAQGSAWFRAIVVDTAPDSFDLKYFGKPYDKEALKWARAYKKFAEMLLSSNTTDIENAVLLTDRLTRTSGDLFLELMRDNFGQAGLRFSEGKQAPTFKHIQEVDTALQEYQLGQINDLLMGVVLNSIYPTANLYKTRLKNHVASTLSLPTFDKTYWGRMTKVQQEIKHPKFGIWFWESKEIKKT